MVVPGVKFVAKLTRKIPGYKDIAALDVGEVKRKSRKTGRKTLKLVRNTARKVGSVTVRGAIAVKDGAVFVGRKSMNLARGTRRLAARMFGRRSRKQSRSTRRLTKKSPAKRSARKSPNRPKKVRARTANKQVRFASNVRNTANAKPIERELTPAVPAAAPIVAPAPVAAAAIPIKSLNSPVGTAAANMSVAPKPY